MAEPIRLYLDEDAQRTSLVRALRARRIDVLTANEVSVVIRRLLRLLDGRRAEDMHNWLEFLSNWR
jgi:hypothetical protein